MRNRYQQYRRDAEQDRRAFELTLEQFATLTQQPCHYCGQLPATSHTGGGKNGYTGYRGSFTYNGLDRRDNSLGYTLANVLPCCPECNRAKRHQQYETFVAWLDRIARFRSK